jgi:four helix bundle protein
VAATTARVKITERTFSFALQGVRLCQKLYAKSGMARNLAQQLLKSSTSVGANIEEAQAAQSRADFVNKCSIALKECRETIYWLRLLEASGLCRGDDLAQLSREADEISRIIGAIIVRTKQEKSGGLRPLYF